MMLETLVAIAMLCQAPEINAGKTIEQKQMECQKWYVKCVEEKMETGSKLLGNGFFLKECIKEKK
jgi:hypothetical protein